MAQASTDVSSAAPVREEIVIRPPGPYSGLHLTELWRFRGMLARKVKQRIRVQYDDMLLGFFWAVARPVIMVLVFLGFRKLADANVGVSIPYPLYLYSGLVVWFFFTEATVGVAMSLQRDAGLIQKIYFPRLLSPLSYLLAEAYNLAMASYPLAILIAAFGEPPDWKVLLLPLVVAQLLLLSLGVGLVFSALVLIKRDWERVLKFSLYVGLWVSPVIYSFERVPEKLKLFYLVNPMSGTLLAIRATLFGSFAFPWSAWLYALIFSLLLAKLGLYLFQMAERTVADKL